MSKEDLLRHIQRTNPEMTMERMLEELSKCQYSAVALCMVCENDKRSTCNE
ncbi:MAG: hypothetical protein HFH72_08620 [Lachnospiraceae bacterium]|nr:hypothetical protein [Lachnospiraceae bacterium]